MKVHRDLQAAVFEIPEKGAVIRDAADPFQPAKDELDLRYRSGSNSAGTIRVAALSIPSDNDLIYDGWKVLAGEMEQMLHLKVIVDVFSVIDEKINDYDMVYIGAAGTFSPTDIQLAILKNFMANGKGILLEGLDSNGSKALKDLAEAFKATPVDPDNCRFYQTPFFFRLPPDQINEKRLMAGKRVIFCADSLVETWSGELKGELLPRYEIRSNLEWGANLVMYCVR